MAIPFCQQEHLFNRQCVRIIARRGNVCQLRSRKTNNSRVTDNFAAMGVLKPMQSFQNMSTL